MSGFIIPEQISDRPDESQPQESIPSEQASQSLPSFLWRH